MKISLIAAIAQHRVIGHRGSMPWHLPQELAYFKRMTLNKPILMGRHTFLSIGHALPQRRNIVISTQPNLRLPDCEVYSSLESALEAVAGTPEVMIIGGGHLFHSAWSLAQRLYLSLIDADVPGDTFFPAWDMQEWHVITRQYYPADQHNPYSFETLILERNSIAGI